jgi:murein hydrolase activator
MILRDGPVALGALALLFVGLAGPAAHAQSREERELKSLDSEQAQREAKVAELERQAQATRAEIARLRAALVAAAERRRTLEREAEQQEVRLVALRRQENAARARLTRDRAALEDVMAALIAFERQRPPPLIARPDSAVEAVRAAILLGEVAPPLRDRARRIAAEIDALRALRRQVLDQNARLQAAEAALERQRKAVLALIAQRATLEARLEADAARERARIAEIVRRSADLRDLIGRLSQTGPGLPGPALPPSPDFPQRFAQAQGLLSPPVPGRIVRAFGERLGSGVRSDGIVIAARRQAQITAPFDGRVDYAGPFRSYGSLLILNVGGGYHLVIAGMGSTYAQAGVEVLAGEPLGEMPGGDAPELYVEVRRDGQPIDPRPWFRRAGAAPG